MRFDTLYLDTIDSTQNYAKTHIVLFDASAITCIVAEEQTNGRGQFQRKWTSPRGVNLYATLVFRLPLPCPQLNTLAIVMAKTIKTVLQKENIPATLKWPNDVQIHNKKVAGALCETIFHPTFIDIFLGFGLNVNMEQEDLTKIDQPATSLKEETGKIWDKNALLEKIQAEFLLQITQEEIRI